MYKRWKKEIKDTLPELDVADSMDDLDFMKRRQFAPEYSQNCYVAMLKQEQAIGSYIDIEGLPSNIISKGSRKLIVQLIRSLHQIKNYKIETLYLAISIADRYLVNLVIRMETETINFMSLAVTCLFLAAKIE